MTPTSSENVHLVYNARIYQSGSEDDDDMTWMTFDEVSGVITAVGRQDPTPSLERFPPDRRRDADGRRIIPGLHDSHVHLAYLGSQLRTVDLKGCRSIEEVLYIG